MARIIRAKRQSAPEPSRRKLTATEEDPGADTQSDPVTQQAGDNVYDGGAGNQDSAPLDKPQLRAIEGGGETSEPNRSWYKPDGSKDGADAKDLAESENSAGETAAPDQEPAEHEDQLGKGYTPGAVDMASMAANPRRWFYKNRRKVFGGGIIGGVVGLFFAFTLVSGPLEFVHLAELLTQFHFASLQNEQDDRFTKEVRFWRYAKSGQIEKTRMGILGNKLGSRFEAKLNASGLESVYSDKFGLFNGYAIDTVSPESPYYGMDEEEAAAAVKQNTGLDVVKGESISGHSVDLEGRLAISAEGLGYKDTLKLNYSLLRQAGYSKISAANGARLLCVRAACTSFLHPLTRLLNDKKATLEDRWNARNSQVEEGSEALEITDNTAEPDQTADANAARDTANTDQAKGTVKAVDDASKGPFDGFKNFISAKLLGAAAGAVAVVCMVKTVNDHVVDIKQTQVILPLIRKAMEAIGLGYQVMSGQDVDLAELSQNKALLDGKDSSGKVTSWTDAPSIASQLGNPVSGGVNDTLSSIGKGSPFANFLNGISSTTHISLNKVCSAGGQAVTAGLSIAMDLTGIGDIINLVGSAIATSAAQGPIIDLVSHWLSGTAVNPVAAGADYGSDADYGSRLAANDQALASGGVALSSTDSGELDNLNNNLAQQNFSNHNIAYRLFDPYDQRSVISKVIDNTSPSPSQNLSKIGMMFLNFGHNFGSIFDSLLPKAHAATVTAYNYGFPSYGFSESEMDNPKVQNPYQNAGDVEGYLDSKDTFTGSGPENGKTYVQMAQDCFGVTIANDGTAWGVTSGDGASPKVYGSSDYAKLNCADGSDSRWLQVRFFIMDSETMNSLACYQGDDSDPDINQACTDIGFGDSASASAGSGATSSSPTGSLPSGSSQQLAKQLLPFIASGKIFCGSAAGGIGPANCSDIQNTAAGKPLGGNCAVSAITPHLLGLILGLVQTDGWKLGISAICSDHAAEGDGPYAGHSYGSAADFSVQNGSSGAAAAADEKFVNDAAALLSSTGGSFGQIECHPAYAVLTNSQFTTFSDACTHQHIRAAP
ncbi:MAG TPA: hypothetical protein VMT23_01990 [Candidatus Binatia bacterium]|nr:hypothetical protein [Candidatus Binatia bacterium]